MAVDLMLAAVATGKLTEFDWKALEDQVRFTYNYGEGKIMALSAVPPLVRLRASGAIVREVEQAEVKSGYLEEFASRRMSIKYARLAWRRYSADSTDVKAIPTLEEQDALTRPASPFVSAAMTDV